MTSKERLLKRLPKKYHEVVKDFTEESDFLGICKYILYFTDKYINVNDHSIRTASIEESILIVKETYNYLNNTED